ncbi:restriction endonuclease subunit S [Enterobacter bugandensis]|uniref:restriction endonuclease subunit S n=1 Tax=Enterobacter bugandensis TaxID=881260 RepID=UPI0021D1ACC0|nr:restriction endonuclease subunit S [Enterobacter bugandensis]MCU6187736.1 restriction endonuclease subunit S [Enterobacter bugandensis]
MSGGKLPEGWVDTQLGNIVDYGKANKRVLSDVNDDTWVLELEDIEKESSKLLSTIRASERPFKSTKNSFKKGDVLYGKLRPYLNKIIIAKEDGVCTTEIIPLSAEPLCCNKYIFYWLKSSTFLGYVNDVSYGVNMPRLGTADGLKAPLRLAPLGEQKIIAEKLDALLAQVDSTKARLEQIPQILKRFRQAVLIAAFTKKLTESSEFTEKKISDVCSFQNGFAFKSSWFSKTGSYQVIKLANIRDGYLFLENAPAYVNEEQGVEFSKFSPNIGDVLISMTGTRFKKDYGFGCIMTQKHKALINQRVGRLIPIKASILPEYLFLFVRSELFREQFFKGETGGVNQGNVGSQHIQSILINVPPLTEQHEIVRRVEQLFAYTDTIEKQVNNALALVNSLTQSLLAKAFRGELTAQWRAENPDLISGENSATALLERIKAERAASSGKKSSRKKA